MMQSPAMFRSAGDSVPSEKSAGDSVPSKKKFHTERMFTLGRMRLRKHVDTQLAKCFKR